jgi:NADH:ubiquinone oxidoreductase subunit 4 (subunit M)
MNLVVLGLFANNYNALNGSLSLTIGHGFVSAAMFLLIGTLYDRYHSRLIFHYSGFAQTMPIFAIIFILFSLANIGFPLSYNFIGELQIILGLISKGLLYGFIGLLGIILSIIYTM